MRARALTRTEHGTQFALVFDVGDEVVEQLTNWCNEQQVTAARLTGIGGFSRAAVAWFDWEAREFREITVAEQVELLTLGGDIAEQDGKAAVHAHVVLGKRDGTTRGGHLINAYVRPTLELIVDEAPAHLRRRYDPVFGLALIALEQSSGRSGFDRRSHLGGDRRLRARSSLSPCLERLSPVHDGLCARGSRSRGRWRGCDI